MVTITTARNQLGNDEVHRGGCAHLEKRGLRKLSDHHGDTLLAAIRAADTEMADAFGQAVYQPDPSDQPWTVTALHWAPCFADMVRVAGLTFDPDTGQPFAPVPA